MADRVLGGIGDVDSIFSGTGCASGGVEKIFYGKFSDFDWAGAGTTIDATTKQLTALAANATKTLYEITYDIENTRVRSELQNRTFYQTDVTTTVFGRTESVQAVINNMQQLCGDLFMIVFGKDKFAEVIGVTEATDGTIVKVFDPLEISTHGNDTGVPGEKSRNELVVTCRSVYAPLSTTLTIAECAALLTAA